MRESETLGRLFSRCSERSFRGAAWYWKIARLLLPVRRYRVWYSNHRVSQSSGTTRVNADGGYRGADRTTRATIAVAAYTRARVHARSSLVNPRPLLRRWAFTVCSAVLTKRPTAPTTRTATTSAARNGCASHAAIKHCQRQDPGVLTKVNMSLTGTYGRAFIVRGRRGTDSPS